MRRGPVPTRSLFSASYCTNLSNTTNSFPVADTHRKLATLIYNATLDAWIKHGGDVSLASCGIQNGAPIETILNLAWTVGAHPWMVSPAYAMDPMTNFWPNVMLYDKTNQPGWAKLRIEPPNELWNTASGFIQAAFAMRKVTVYNANDSTNWTFPSDYHQWYGMVLSKLGQTAYQIYGAGKLDVDYQLIGAVQTATGANSGDIANSLNRFRAAAYVGAGTVPVSTDGCVGHSDIRCGSSRAVVGLPCCYKICVTHFNCDVLHQQRL